MSVDIDAIAKQREIFAMPDKTKQPLITIVKVLKKQFNDLRLFNPHKFARNHTNILWKNALEIYASVL